MTDPNYKKGWGITGKYRKAHYFDDQISTSFSICGRILSFGMTAGKGRVGLCKLCMKKRRKLYLKEKDND